MVYDAQIFDKYPFMDSEFIERIPKKQLLFLIYVLAKIENYEKAMALFNKIHSIDSDEFKIIKLIFESINNHSQMGGVAILRLALKLIHMVKSL